MFFKKNTDWLTISIYMVYIFDYLEKGVGVLEGGGGGAAVVKQLHTRWTASQQVERAIWHLGQIHLISPGFPQSMIVA